MAKKKKAKAPPKRRTAIKARAQAAPSGVLELGDRRELFIDDYLIERVEAKRSINSNPSRRGKLTELLITNDNYKKR